MISSDIKYSVCFVCACVVRLAVILFSVYMILWLQSFETLGGGGAGSKEALIIYRRIIMLSMVLTGLLLPVIGYVADKTPSRVLVPLAFFTRCCACFLFVSI